MAPVVCLKLRDVVHQHLRLVHLVGPCLDVGPLMRLTYSGSKTAGMGLMRRQRVLHLIEQRGFQHLGVLTAASYAVVFEDVPATENQIVETGQRDEII